ncbi:Tyrosine recombinase XerD [Microbacterium ginsengisoli]|uniref:Tyrosine recombinase XerD n=1 Tax=Microbacterium ginsengisoli TaxID=400772 RepID=A0A0F0LV71_9MICO|nr:tyrosine-type recombinase/integrase [Microbacterium ginsengisoli]KJL37033.1 Tyrosine recombinase XerD [Microbacterium ginsengisoli]
MSDTIARPAAHTITPAEHARTGFLSRYTGGTAALYGLDLRIYFDWCATHGIDPLDARRHHIEAFETHLAAEKHNAPRSVRRRLQTIRGFYRLAYADEYIDRDPTVLLRMPRVHRDITRLVWLDRFQIGALLRTAAATSPAHHALVALMAIGGLRVSGACAARLENLHQSTTGEWTLTVTEKGDRPHIVDIPPVLHEIIQTTRNGRTEGPIVRKRNGDPQTRHGAYAWVRALGAKTGIPDAHPHALRRAAIATVIDSGASMETARDFAGHAETSTTELYHRRRGAAGVPGSAITAAIFSNVA